jgi:hypothetical protein
VCWKLRSSCSSLHLLREEFLSAPIHSPPLSGSPYRSFNILDAGGSFHVGHGRDLLRVGFDSTMANDKAE